MKLPGLALRQWLYKGLMAPGVSARRLLSSAFLFAGIGFVAVSILASTDEPVLDSLEQDAVLSALGVAATMSMWVAGYFTAAWLLRADRRRGRYLAGARRRGDPVTKVFPISGDAFGEPFWLYDAIPESARSSVHPIRRLATDLIFRGGSWPPKGYNFHPDIAGEENHDIQAGWLREIQKQIDQFQAKYEAGAGAKDFAVIEIAVTGMLALCLVKDEVVP